MDSQEEKKKEASVRLGVEPEEGWTFEYAPKVDASGKQPAQGPIIRSTLAKDGLTPPVFEGCKTLHEVFERSVSLYKDMPCLGTRHVEDDGTASEYRFATYGEIGEQVTHLASALMHQGIQSKDAVGVFGANSAEWMVAMQACNRMNAKTVPLYDTLGETAVEFIIEHASCKAIIVQAAKIGDLIKSKGKVPSVKLIGYWGDASESDLEAIESMGVPVFSFADLIQVGAKNPKGPQKSSPDDTCTLMYTSGTTGTPKGVVIKQSNIMSQMSSVRIGLKQTGNDVHPDDVFISYLPLAHIFDRIIEEYMLASGASIGYWQGNVKKLIDDIGALRPTIFAGVPRIYDRIYNTVMAKAESSFVFNLLFKFATSRKFGNMKRGTPQAHSAPMMDRILFSKIKARLGGKVKLIMSGGAPLAPHVEKFLRTAMCCPVVQGYGLTETMASTFCAVPDNIKHFGTVGIPFPSVEYRLEAVPDMNYSPFSDPPRGEVIIRGNSVFAGYFNDKEKTAEAIDKDGFFHTGDIGEITPDGCLKIIDRKKNIFKLSQGEYIAVESIESTYKKNLFVEQIWVYGNSFESCLVAVVVPNEAKLMDWASKVKGIDGDFASICAKTETKEMMLSELTSTGRLAKLKGFEIIKALHVDAVEFSVDNDLITPTFKLKRPQLLKYYKDTVDALYTELR